MHVLFRNVLHLQAQRLIFIFIFLNNQNDQMLYYSSRNLGHAEVDFFVNIFTLLFFFYTYELDVHHEIGFLVF